MRPMRIAGGVSLACLLATAAMASSVLGLSIEDQARLSKMVVVGEVVGQNGKIDAANGYETAVRLRVTDVLKGRVQVGQTVVFHTRGGEVDGVISQALGEAVFQTGQKYLVFIESVDGRLYNLGLSMGVWNVTETGGGIGFTRALEDGLEVVGDVQVEHGPISLPGMASRVSLSERQGGFDHPMLRESLEGR